MSFVAKILLTIMFLDENTAKKYTLVMKIKTILNFQFSFSKTESNNA